MPVPIRRLHVACKMIRRMSDFFTKLVAHITRSLLIKSVAQRLSQKERSDIKYGITALLLLNQYSPVPRARSSTAGKDATRPVGARVARAHIYAGLGRRHQEPFIWETYPNLVNV